METWIYILLVRNYFKAGNYEYAAAIAPENFSLWASYDEATDVLIQAKNQLIEAGYVITNSGNGGEAPSTLYWCRLENGHGRSAVLSIHKKTVQGELFQIERG